MTKIWIEEKIAKVSKMGFDELMDYKEEVISSLVDNPTKFFLYDIIDERLIALDAQSAAVAYDDSDFDLVGEF